MEGLSNVPKGIRLVSGRARICARQSDSRGHHLKLYTNLTSPKESTVQWLPTEATENFLCICSLHV